MTLILPGIESLYETRGGTEVHHGLVPHSLVFNEDERGPADQSLRLHLAAIDQLDPDEQASIRALIEGALLRHQARRLSAS